MGFASLRWLLCCSALALPLGCAKSDPQSPRPDMAMGSGDMTVKLEGDMVVPPMDLFGVEADPDLATPGKDAAAPGPCNVVTQTGCGDNQKCAYTDPNAGAVMTHCIADGQELSGQPCNDGTNGDCLGANLCIVEDEDAMVNSCRPWCDDDTNCTALGIVGPENRAWCDLPITGYPSKLCTQPCNPVPNAGATGCLPGLGCRYYTITRGAMTFEATNCAEVGTKVLGDNCANTNECAGALVCAAVDAGQAKCRAVCRNQLNAMDMKPNDCATGEVCQALDGLSDPFFGVCLPST